jgi:LysM repeat protein
MENDSISSSSSESKLPLIVGILGFALGAAGLVYGIKAKGAAQAANDEAVAARTSVSELSNALAGKANSADVAALRADLDKGFADVAVNEKTLSDQIKDLQKLQTSKPVANGKAATPPGPGEYVVAKGDTLGGIAKKVGLSVKALQDLNPGVNPNRMQIGQRLKTK